MGTLQLPAFVVALGSVVSVIVSATKGGIEQLLPATNRWHDLAFTLYPMALTLALVVGYTATHGGDMFWSIVWGLLSGAWAVGAYTVHTRTGTTLGVEASGVVASRIDPSSPRASVEPPPGHAPDWGA